MKKNPTKPDAQIDDDRLYAPAWASERSPPGETQTSSPGLPVASTTDLPSPDRPTPSAPSGMAKGIGGPNVESPPRLQSRPQYGGDIAGNELRRRSSHKFEVVTRASLEGLPRRSCARDTEAICRRRAPLPIVTRIRDCTRIFPRRPAASAVAPGIRRRYRRQRATSPIIRRIGTCPNLPSNRPACGRARNQEAITPRGRRRLAPAGRHVRTATADSSGTD